MKKHTENIRTEEQYNNAFCARKSDELVKYGLDIECVTIFARDWCWIFSSL